MPFGKPLEEMRMRLGIFLTSVMQRCHKFTRKWKIGLDHISKNWVLYKGSLQADLAIEALPLTSTWAVHFLYQLQAGFYYLLIFFVCMSYPLKWLWLRDRKKRWKHWRTCIWSWKILSKLYIMWCSYFLMQGEGTKRLWYIWNIEKVF